MKGKQVTPKTQKQTCKGKQGEKSEEVVMIGDVSVREYQL